MLFSEVIDTRFCSLLAIGDVTWFFLGRSLGMEPVVWDFLWDAAQGQSKVGTELTSGLAVAAMCRVRRSILV